MTETVDSASPDDATATETAGTTSDTSRPESELVPLWLAALVLFLLLAVVGVGGYLLRGALSHDNPSNRAEIETSKWEDQVAASPDDPSALLNLGFAYQQAERYRDAIDEYDAVLKLQPKNTAALYNKGTSLLALGKGDQAEETLWDVLEIEPDHILAAKSLGEYYAGKEQYKSLLAAVGPVLETTESAADLQALAGLAYENLGDTERAVERYRLALKYYPDMKEARDGLERLGVKQ